MLMKCIAYIVSDKLYLTLGLSLDLWEMNKSSRDRSVKPM